MRKNHGKGVAYANVDGRDIIYVVTPAFFLHAIDGETGEALGGFADGRRSQMITDGERLYLAGDRTIYGLEPDPAAELASPPVESDASQDPSLIAVSSTQLTLPPTPYV